jgi:hypothetical protein
VSMADIERDVTGKREGIRAAVDGLVREDRARKVRGPRGAHILRLVRPAQHATTSPHEPGRGQGWDGGDLT